MWPSAEAAILLLVLALYLQDSLLLLYDNEGVLEAGPARRYRVYLGARTLHLAGRTPFLANPLTPWRPIYRLTWSSSAHSSDGSVAGLEQSSAVLRSIGWGLPPVAVGLFTGLPLCLHFNAGWRPFLMLVAVMYVAVLTMLTLVWQRRAAFHLDGKRFATICLETLLCLPCALNLVRKVSAHQPVRADLVEAARAVASQHDFQWLVARLLRRIDEDIEAADAGGAQWQALTQYRARLAGLMP